jgi:hypothetical protein
MQVGLCVNRTRGCSTGPAPAMTTKGVVLASGPYAIGKSASAVVPLELTPAGSWALAGAGVHPMYEDLAVTVRGGKEVRTSNGPKSVPRPTAFTMEADGRLDI